MQSVDRALMLLEALSLRPEGMRLSDLARDQGLAPSTTHRLLTTLEHNGFARLDPDGSRWQVGRKAFAVGLAFSDRQGLVAAALPIMRRLRDATRATANLGVLEDGQVVILARVESREITRAIAPRGGRAPLLNSGLGKAILATWPDEAIAALVAREGLAPRTAQSLRDMDALQAEIARIRQDGHARDNEEFTTGLRCAAAVVWSAASEPLAALSVSSAADRVSPARLRQMGERVRDMAMELTTALGGSAPACTSDSRPLSV